MEKKSTKVFRMSKFGMNFRIIIDQPTVIAKAIYECDGKDLTEFRNGDIVGKAECRTDMDKFSTRYGVLLAVKRALCKYHGKKIEEYQKKMNKHKRYMKLFKESLNKKMGQPQPVEEK